MTLRERQIAIQHLRRDVPSKVGHLKFWCSGNERHRDIEKFREASVLYSLLSGCPSRRLGIAPGASSGTVGTLSLSRSARESVVDIV